MGQQPDGAGLANQLRVGQHHVAQLQIDAARQEFVGVTAFGPLAFIDANRFVERSADKLVPVGKPQRLLVAFAVGRDHVFGEGHVEQELRLQERRPAGADNGCEQDDQEGGGKAQGCNAVHAEPALGGIALLRARAGFFTVPGAGRCAGGFGGNVSHQSYCSR